MNNLRGNALFLILIAVALFAALSYAVTQSGRGGSGIDREQAEIQAAQITQYASSIEQAIIRLKLINECSDTEMSFHNDSDGDGVLETNGHDEYYNANAAGKTECYIFDTNGGSISRTDLSADFYNSNCQDQNGAFQWWCGRSVVGGRDIMPGMGSTDPDLVLYMTSIPEAVCKALNTKLNGTSTIPTSSYNGTLFTGSYGTPSSYTSLVPSGSHSGCFQRATSPVYYVYYHTLIAR